MDASSLLLSLPSSISGAVDFGQRFHYAREFQLESSDAATQLRFLTRQLDNWRRCVGITDGDELQDVHDEALDDSEILELVGDDLDSIRKHTQNLKKRLSKLGVERSPGPRASVKPGSQLLLKRDAGRPKSPIPSLKGVSWGYGRDKLVWGELDRVAQAVGHLYELIPPKVSPPEDDAEKKKAEDRRAQTREILEWLRAPQIDQQYDTHINARLDGTCGWIFDHEAYKTWTSELDKVGMPKLLWIHGPAGTGKTVLSAAIIRERTEALKSGQSILYCFCSSFAQANAKFEDVIRIWIWQLIHQDPSAVESIWNEYMNSSNIERGTVASQTEVWKIWKDLLSKRVGCAVVIDGFDEFDRTYRVESKFLQKIKQVAAQTKANILITSRNEEDIQHALSSGSQDTSEILMLECLVSKELVRGDLDLLASKVINDVLHSKSDEVRKDLASRLAVRSDGMFLWIKQQNMGQLRPGKPLKQLQQMVDRMPSGLKETYRKIWDEIERRERVDKERTLGILRLIAFAFRPLTVAEITEALLVKPGYDDINLDEWPDAIDEEYIKSEIKGLCGSLIDIRSPGGSDVPGSKTLHLAHVSVKEFLVEELCTRTAKEDSEVKKLKEHHTELAKVCLRIPWMESFKD
ncbi:Ankyrin repeat and SOCS box protein 7 [Lasiodiplodia theobromae]|uniref:Ankyrin repeat and SOCS box protein 7 n=1 Tax=Lasiodiplodia theobromae TaxID=45133 RepID=UPI0015C3BD27|nr:Ankyrin repeat and SOCS box protein 7 [Lasiodiplodia theobromae]KAF4541828.1 Ankyrin repeat and SOCS box protein 7 [Lasiodiplodia theobromae]